MYVKSEDAQKKDIQNPAPAEAWMEKAEAFVTWAQGELAKNEEVLAWLASRGIPKGLAETYRLGLNPGDKGKDLYRPRSSWGLPEEQHDDGPPKRLWIPRGLVIPHIEGGIVTRIRIRRPEGEPRYYVIPGSSMATMVLGAGRRAYVVVEAELDAIAVMGATDLAGAVGLGSSSTKPNDKAFELLTSALKVLVALDYDKAGAKAIAWWTDNVPRSVRWPVPKGKDPGEAKKEGVDLAKWIEAGLPPVMMIDRIQAARQADVQARFAQDRDDYRNRLATPQGEIPEDRLAELPAGARELYDLLRKYRDVTIINSSKRYTVYKGYNQRYVGGRIGELVFRDPEVLAYISGNPDEEINWSNFIYGF